MTTTESPIVQLGLVAAIGLACIWVGAQTSITWFGVIGSQVVGWIAIFAIIVALVWAYQNV